MFGDVYEGTEDIATESTSTISVQCPSPWNGREYLHEPCSQNYSFWATFLSPIASVSAFSGGSKVGMAGLPREMACSGWVVACRGQWILRCSWQAAHSLFFRE